MEKIFSVSRQKSQKWRFSAENDSPQAPMVKSGDSLESRNEGLAPAFGRDKKIPGDDVTRNQSNKN